MAKRRRPLIRLRPARYEEPLTPPIYDEREARANELVSRLDSIEEDVRRRPKYASSQLETLQRHYLPVVRQALRERWPYAREIASHYRSARRAAKQASSPARDPQRKQRRPPSTVRPNRGRETTTRNVLDSRSGSNQLSTFSTKFRGVEVIGDTTIIKVMVYDGSEYIDGARGQQHEIDAWLKRKGYPAVAWSKVTKRKPTALQKYLESSGGRDRR